mmetsp:Transcript_34201/g.43149  ORF Transcript_34201/g.43149 Transcript_34201/m.43149 type:complete len:661 (-) Transcript_34201:202-2184(-)
MLNDRLVKMVSNGPLNISEVDWVALQTYLDNLMMQIEGSTSSTLHFLFVISAANILLMQAGFALFEVGTVQAKNAKSILFKNLIDCCIGIISWWLVGFNLSYYGFAGWDGFGNIPNEKLSQFFHSYSFSVTCITILSGGVAERISFKSYMAFSILLSSFFYPYMAFVIWSKEGWLHKLGFIDFAGVAAIHVVGGAASLAASIQLGPRIGRFTYNPRTKMVEANEMKGHSPVLSNVGVFILLFGWLSFNASSIHESNNAHFELCSRAATNTMLSAGSAALTGCVWHWSRFQVHDLCLLHCYLMSGAVAITGCCAYVDAWAAAMIGAVSILFYNVFSSLLLSFHVDDPLDAFPVHGGAGIWGTLAVGLFCKPGSVPPGFPHGFVYHGGFHLLGAQAVGVLSVIAWAGLGFWLILYLMDSIPRLNIRVDVDHELLGLDFAYHDGFAYPDFNKHSIITFNEIKMAEKRVEARHKGKRQNRRKVVDLTTIRTTPKKKRKEKCIGHAGGTSLSNSSFSDSYDTSTASNDSFHSPIATMETVTLNSITTRPNTPSRRCTMMGNFALNYSVTSHPNLLCRSRSSSKQCQNPLDIRRHVGNYPLDQDDEIKQERQHIDNVAPSFAKEETLPNNIPANLKISCTSSPTSLHSKNKGLMNHNSTYNSRVEE